MFRRQRPGVWPQPAAGTFGIAAATGTVIKASEDLQLESKFTEPQSWLFNSKPQQPNHAILIRPFSLYTVRFFTHNCNVDNDLQ